MARREDLQTLFCFSPSYFRVETLLSCHRLSKGSTLFPGSCPQHRPQTSLPLQGQLETPACEEPTARGVFFVLHETLAPALRAKVLYIATIMVTKLPSAKTKSLSVCWGGNVSWGEMEGVLLPCPLQNFPQKLQARMPINANWDFFICGHVSIRNLIDRLRQVTHFAVARK